MRMGTSARSTGPLVKIDFPKGHKKRGCTIHPWSATPYFYLEAATGFEPVNNGFADRCLSHLAMPPEMTGAGERI